MLTQLSIAIIKLINVKIKKNCWHFNNYLSTASEFESKKSIHSKILIFYEQLKFHAHLSAD